MGDCLVTVVVPVYKVEKYLDRCVESIINQTYRNLEIILVDDGSPDCCPQMCDTWAERDPRIKVIHKENGGLSDARNAGLDVSKGKYIVFVDADDYVEREYITYLYRLIMENQADLATCEFRFVKEDGRLINHVENNGDVVAWNQQEALYQLCDGTMVHNAAWAKIYDSEIFHDIRYPKGKIFEDLGTTYKLLLRAERVVLGKKALYNYVRHEGTIMTSEFQWDRMCAIDFAEEMYNAVVGRFPSLQKIAKKKLFCEYIGVLRVILLSGDNTERVKSASEEIFGKLCSVRAQAWRCGLTLRLKCCAICSCFGKAALKVGFQIEDKLNRMIKLREVNFHVK